MTYRTEKGEYKCVNNVINFRLFIIAKKSTICKWTAISANIVIYNRPNFVLFKSDSDGNLSVRTMFSVSIKWEFGAVCCDVVGRLKVEFLKYDSLKWEKIGLLKSFIKLIIMF